MRRAYDPAQRTRQEARFPSVQQRVADYFNAQETIDFYRDFWDREHYHFGYFQWGMNPLNLAVMTDEMTRRVIARIGIGYRVPVDGTVLDLGCGIGGTARMLARMYPKLRVIGVTISARQTEIARARSDAAGLSDRLTFFTDDFTDLRTVRERVDAAVSIESACHAPDPDKADVIREAARLVKPGGRLVVADGFRTSSQPLYPALDRAYRYWCDGWRVPGLADIHRFRAALGRYGFEGIESADLSWRVAPSMAYGVAKAMGSAVRMLARGRLNIVEHDRHEWMVGFSAAFLGLNKHRFGYYLIGATRGDTLDGIA
jgi:cyclopropane fatty-acyl-phospholipid synthase-like methyltransferase